MSAALIAVGCGYLGLFVGLGVLWRHNQRVYRVRMALIDQVSHASDVDIWHGRAWRWRYEAMEAVSYMDMIRHPLRDPLSLYPDTKFAEVTDYLGGTQ